MSSAKQQVIHRLKDDMKHYPTDALKAVIIAAGNLLDERGVPKQGERQERA